MATVRKVVISSVVLCMVMFSPYAEAAITCSQVASAVGPCLGYLQNRSPAPPPAACCNGIRNLNSAATTTPDRQTVCTCLKNIAGTVKGIDLNKAAALPGKCGVNVPFPISLRTDCSKVR